MFTNTLVVIAFATLLFATGSLISMYNNLNLVSILFFMGSLIFFASAISALFIYITPEEEIELIG